MDRTPRVVGIVLSGGWILFSAMSYDRAVIAHAGNPWLRALVVLGLVVGLPIFARLWMDEGRQRERERAERTKGSSELP
jgi:hypothetical protein